MSVTHSVTFLFLAAILAGFALVNIPDIPLLAGLHTFFVIVGVLAIIVFSFVILYIALKALFHKSWH
jgi:hypothetical protein